MALRNVVLEGDEILRKRAREIDQIDDRIRVMLDDMIDTMREANGVGLAAPQIGVMRRMFVAEPEPGRVYYMVNPEMLEQDGAQRGSEACLSIPGIAGEVERPQHIKLNALNRDGEEKIYDFADWDAVVMCHEYDHLEGILFVDRAESVGAAHED